LNIVTRKQKNNLINIKYWWVKRGDEEGEKEKQETIATSWSLFLSSFFSFLAFFFFFFERERYQSIKPPFFFFILLLSFTSSSPSFSLSLHSLALSAAKEQPGERKGEKEKERDDRQRATHIEIR
jgi:hypothetical protein